MDTLCDYFRFLHMCDNVHQVYSPLLCSFIEIKPGKEAKNNHESLNHVNEEKGPK